MTQDAKEKLFDWLFSQGVSTVLLCGILAFIAYGVVFLIPAHNDQIEQGYGRNALIVSKALEAMALSHDRDRQMFVDLLSGRQLENKP